MKQHNTRISILHCLHWWCFALLLMLCAQHASAVDYIFPTNMPIGCSQTNPGVYTCNSLAFGFNDTVTIAGTKPATINVNGTLKTDNVVINQAGNVSDVLISVSGEAQIDYQAFINASLRAGNVRGADQAVIVGSITTTTGSINLAFRADVRGGLVSTTGNITLGTQTRIASITCSCNVSVGDASVILGDVIASTVSDNGTKVNYQGAILSTGEVRLGFGASVAKGIISNDKIRFGGESNIQGCVQSKTSNEIRLDWKDVVQGVCCGNNNCNSSCVKNDSGLTMPPNCSNSTANAANFNCVAVGAAANTGRLFTQLVANNFNIDVVALKPDGTIETKYVTPANKGVKLEFVDGSGNTACNNRTAINPAVSQTVSFTANDVGRKTVSNLNIGVAYRNIRCRVTDSNQTPAIVGCSSDNFAVRPTGLSVSATNANADTTGVSVSATPAIKAGANFNLTAASGAVGYDGTPIIDATKLNAHTGAVRAGVIAGVFSPANANTGTASGNGFSYTEVGYFNLGAYGVYDNTFTAVDAANGDCATGFFSAGGKQACSFGNTVATTYFGRFIPDHFAVTLGSTTPACSLSATPAKRFSYFGQDGLGTGFSLKAENASNQTTQNYTGGFAKFGLNTWSNYVFNATGLPVGASLTASTTAPTGTWINGSATISAKHIVTRPSSPVNASTISVSITPVDSDGVTMPLTNVSSASLFYFGRLQMQNAYGSELLPLTVPIEAQYWNGIAYQRNSLDICSVIPTNSVAMGNYKGNLSACESSLTGGSTMIGGHTALRLSAPAANNHGSVDLSINLSSASGATCTPSSTAASSAAMPWFGVNPNARATFGLFKSPLIYLRESY